MSVLAVAELDGDRLGSASLHLLGAAMKLGGDVHVLVAGTGIDALAAQVARLAGVTRVLVADGEALRHGAPENVCAQVLELAPRYSHILFPATTWGKGVAPRVAALLGAFQISDIIAVDGPDTFQRPIYAGSLVATVQSLDAIKVITVRPSAFPAQELSDQNAPIESLVAVADRGKGQFVRAERAASDRPELATARIVVSGGRALGSREKFDELLFPLADQLGAAVGASRAAVDAGYAPNDLQVGQTGKIVAPQLYIAVGISGAIQHLAGMKDSKVIVAINKDAGAPIFEVADYALEADLFAAIPELLAALQGL
jgi:electron transfer flavoprotein alpha subunit